MTLKLVYFPIRGRGEPIRYLLHLTDEPFEDFHVSIENWTQNKPLDSPFGGLPYIEKGGKRLGQYIAIARYFAVKHGLAGKDNVEKAQADQYVDGVNDMWPALKPVLGPLLREQNKPKAMEAFKTFNENTLIPFLNRYTTFLEENNTGYLVGNALTWADIMVAEMLDKFYNWDSTIFDKHPAVKKHHQMVYNIPKIKAFADTRQGLPF